MPSLLRGSEKWNKLIWNKSVITNYILNLFFFLSHLLNTCTRILLMLYLCPSELVIFEDLFKNIFIMFSFKGQFFSFWWLKLFFF